MIEKAMNIAAKLREPFIVIILGLASAPLAIGYLMGRARELGMVITFPACWLGFSWLFSSVVFDQLSRPLFDTFPSLSVSADQVWKAWIAEAALVILGVVLAQLRHVVNGGWSIGDFQVSYRPALVLALALPMVAVIETTGVREGDPVRVLWKMEERLAAATPDEIDRFNHQASVFLKTLSDEIDGDLKELPVLPPVKPAAPESEMYRGGR